MPLKNIPNISFKSSEDAKDIEVLQMSDLFSRIENDRTHNPKKPHRISFFALMIVTGGTGVHQVDLKSYPLRKGSVLKIAKGQVHAFQKELQYDGYLVVFTEDFILKYFSKTSIEFISHLYNYHLSEPLVENSKLNEFFLDQIIRELQSENTYAQKEIIAKILELYLLRLERDTHSVRPEKFNKKHYEIFIDFKNMVEKNYAITRNVKDYAGQLYITPKHLNHIVQEVTLNTAKNFIDQYVVLEAKRSILSSGIRLKEIAYEMGFDEVTNFTKFFKKHTGLSPKTYKSALSL